MGISLPTRLLVLVATFLLGCAATPPAADPEAIVFDGALTNDHLLAGAESTVYARLRVRTASLPERERGPVNVALALDTSGSMKGEAIEQAKRASLKMIDALEDGDRLSVVAFHTKTEVLLSSSELDGDVRHDVKRAIEAIRAEGTTDMAGGLSVGLAQVRAHLDPAGVNRVVLLGDGIPNEASAIESSARDAGADGIAVTTLGLGLDYDEILMGRVAQLSGGRFRYVDQADKVAGFFADELRRLDSIYARRASLVLTAGPGVRIESVVGIPSVRGERGLTVALGDLAAGDTRDLIVELRVTARKAGSPVELVDAVLTFDDAIGDAGLLERRAYLGAYGTSDVGEIARKQNHEVELGAAIAKASAATLAGLDLIKNGSFTQARQVLGAGAEAALEQAKRTPSPELQRQAEHMRAVASDLPAVDAPRASRSEGYEFEDDALQIAPAPDVARKRKEAHSQAMSPLQ